MRRLQVWNHHKCATGFMTRVLSRLTEDNGLTFASDYRGDIDVAQMRASADVVHIKNAHAGMLNDPDADGVHIVRNPFAVVVLGYYSHLATHALKLNTGIWEKLAAQRMRLQGLDKTKGLWATIEFLLDPEFFPGTPGPLHALNGWPHDDPRFAALRMEDFVTTPGTRLMEAFARAKVDVAGLSVPPDEDFTFAKISGGRQIGEVDESSHYRSGNPDDWQAHLEPGHLAEIRKQCRPVMERYYPELAEAPLHIVPGTAIAPAPLIDAEKERGQVQIGDIALSFRDRDGGGRHYLQRGHSEEYHSRLYSILRVTLDPSACIDIGANYGYTGLLMRRAFPDSHLTLVEPIPWLESYIRHNFAQNGMRFDRLESAICSVPTEGNRSTFGVRPNSSQDSRVVPPPGAQAIETAVVTLDQLASRIGPDEGVYIKIDTQGWEQRVFEGGEGFMSRHHKWFAKTEFAPEWLESQGTDPVALLEWLMARYEIHESVGRVRQNAACLADVVGRSLIPRTAAGFVEYVRNLALHDKGWVDLYVLPPAERRTYGLYALDLQAF